VPSGWVTNEAFLAGHGAAQAVPGPLFTFVAFLGASSAGTPSGWLGGGVALVAIAGPLVHRRVISTVAALPS
jgi:chromate transporter